MRNWENIKFELTESNIKKELKSGIEINIYWPTKVIIIGYTLETEHNFLLIFAHPKSEENKGFL